MHNNFPAANYPYHGQPYHTYIPPHYSQQQPRFNFPSAQVPLSPSHTDPWLREKHAFPQLGGLPSNGHNPPFIPPDADTQKTRRPKRTASAKPPPTSEKTLKPALKKNVARSDSVSAAPLVRTRTESEVRQRLAPMTRTRTHSNPAFLPDHMFVSFHGSNELRLGNIAYQDTLDEIRERLLPMWPHGVPIEITTNHSWRVTFPKNPWSATGPEALTVHRMISELFNCLSRRGYQYLTSINNGYALIFKDVRQDEDSHFFVAYLSRSGHKITLIRPPRRIGEQLGSRLRTAWPYKIAHDAASEGEIYTVELKRNALGAHNLDRDVFVSHTFQEISQMGYKLEATLHLPRVGIFGFGTRREIWVFRGPRIRSRTNSRNGRS